MKKNQEVTFVEKTEKQVPWQKANNMEKIYDLKLVVCYKGQIFVLATVDIYMGKSNSASVMHCYFRLNDTRQNRYGYGSAGGYGYCKRSSSMSHALEWAGIKLEKSINGVGESAMQEALEAIAKKLKYRIFSVI